MLASFVAFSLIYFLTLSASMAHNDPLFGSPGRRLRGSKKRKSDCPPQLTLCQTPKKKPKKEEECPLSLPLCRERLKRKTEAEEEKHSLFMQERQQKIEAKKAQHHAKNHYIGRVIETIPGPQEVAQAERRDRLAEIESRVENEVSSLSRGKANVEVLKAFLQENSRDAAAVKAAALARREAKAARKVERERKQSSRIVSGMAPAAAGVIAPVSAVDYHTAMSASVYGTSYQERKAAAIVRKLAQDQRLQNVLPGYSSPLLLKSRAHLGGRHILAGVLDEPWKRRSEGGENERCVGELMALPVCWKSRKKMKIEQKEKAAAEKIAAREERQRKELSGELAVELAERRKAKEEAKEAAARAKVVRQERRRQAAHESWRDYSKSLDRGVSPAMDLLSSNAHISVNGAMHDEESAPPHEHRLKSDAEYRDLYLIKKREALAKVIANEEAARIRRSPPVPL